MVDRISKENWEHAAKEPLPSWMEGANQVDQNNLEALWSQVQGEFRRELTPEQFLLLFRIAKDSGRSEIRRIVQQHRRHVQGHCTNCVYETWPCTTYRVKVIETE